MSNIEGKKRFCCTIFSALVFDPHSIFFYLQSCGALEKVYDERTYAAPSRYFFKIKLKDMSVFIVALFIVLLVAGL